MEEKGVVSLNKSEMATVMYLLWVSVLLDLGFTFKASCPPRCRCFQNTKTVSCNRINSFPLPAVPNSYYDTVVISQSNLYVFDSLEKWENLKEIYFPQTWLDCDSFESIDIPFGIDFYWGINECNLPNFKTDKPTTFEKSRSDDQTKFPEKTTTSNLHQSISISSITTNYVQNLSTTSLIITSEEIKFFSSTETTNFTNETFSTDSVTSDKKSKFNYWLILFFFNFLVVFAAILAIIVYYLKYKKIPFSRVKSIRSPLPTRSQLDLGSDFSRRDYFSNDCEEIELDSFDSSCNNIYETVRSPYENIPYPLTP